MRLEPSQNDFLFASNIESDCSFDIRRRLVTIVGHEIMLLHPIRLFGDYVDDKSVANVNWMQIECKSSVQIENRFERLPISLKLPFEFDLACCPMFKCLKCTEG